MGGGRDVAVVVALRVAPQRDAAEREGGEREGGHHARDGDRGGARRRCVREGTGAARRGLAMVAVMGAPWDSVSGHHTVPAGPPPRDPRQQASPPWGSPPCRGRRPHPRLEDRGVHARGDERDDQHGERRGHRAHPRRRRPRAAARSGTAAGSGGCRGSRARRRAPEAGTRMSRGPAARKSGTSKPPERRSERRDALLEQQALRAAPPRPGCARRRRCTSGPSA